MASDSSFSTRLCNPFAEDIFPDVSPPAKEGSTLTLHHEAQDQLETCIAQAAHEPPAAVRAGQGRVILLKAPRAGYGKSHLLHRLRTGPAAEMAVVAAVEFDPEGKITWKALFQQVLGALHQPAAAVPVVEPPAAGGASAPPARCLQVTVLDLAARRLFALVNAGLIRNGSVPCAEPGEAAAVLEARAEELFDFTRPDEPVAQWFQDHFEQLLPLGSRLLCEAAGVDESAAALWLRALCGYAQAGTEGDPARLATLRWALRQPHAGARAGQGPGRAEGIGGPGVAESGAGTGGLPAGGGGMLFFQAPPEDEVSYRESLGTLCRLLAISRPLMVLLDHLDGFHGSGPAVLRLANFLNDWRRLSGRTRFILSVNQDLWAQTFLKTLPSALEDRLTGGQISLGGITPALAQDLIRQRLEAWRVPAPVASRFLNGLDLDHYFSQEAGRLVSPRAILRHAARAWQQLWAAGAATTRSQAPGVSSASPSATGPVPARGSQVSSTPGLGTGSTGGYKPAASGQPNGISRQDGSTRKGISGDTEAPDLLPAISSPDDPAEAASPPPTPNAGASAPSAAWPQNTSAPAPAAGLCASGAIMPAPAPAPPGSLSSSIPAEAGSSGNLSRTSASPSAAAAEDSPFPTQRPRGAGAPPETPSVHARLHTLRSHFTACPWLLLDQDRLYHLMKLSGQRLALIRFLETGLPGLPGAAAGVWQSPDSEILFGSEPYEDRNYWAVLIDFARQRSAQVPGSRLVLFSSASSPVNLGVWLHQDEIVAARSRFLDLQTLDHPTLAALYATDEVLRECERGALPLGSTEAFAAVAPQLEGLWKKITRPLPASS